MALLKADGTLLDEVPGGTVLEAQAEADPQIKVLIDVYRDTPYEGAEFPTQMRQLAFRAGQIIRQSQWDAEFVAPTINSISPATGPAAGGTIITITGTGFTTGTTVTVGGGSATSVDVDTATKLKCTTPAHAAGATDVVVTTKAGTATETGGFTYT
jgi:hypothetical protein